MTFILRSIEEIIQNYLGEIPLAHYLKAYFKTHPKLGSRDRKAISEAVYIYYRTANFFPIQTDYLSIISKGIDLCHSDNQLLQKIISNYPLTPDSGSTYQWELGKRNIQLSKGIDKKVWLTAHLQQPNLFIRIGNNQEKHLKTLENKEISFEILPLPSRQSFNCIALPNGSKIDQILPIQDYVIQDYASQSAIALAANYRVIEAQKAKIWDVCAGAGGKSIFWKNLFPEDEVLATDIRKTILYNLKERFRLLGIGGLKTKVMDVTQKENLRTIGTTFDYIICDVPCSGSGTWSRTPEQFYFFKEEKLKQLSEMQFLIATNAAEKLHQNGVFIYITCSVFELENEMVVHQLIQSGKLKLIHQELINGIANKADCMFVAIMQQQG
jgi:16S rRNA (cytosine967-C5)-methyltransferase